MEFPCWAPVARIRGIPNIKPPVWTLRRLGQSTVELAIILPLFVLILLGAIDFGQVMYGYVTASSAVQAGAEYSARTKDFTSTGVKNVILAEAGGVLTPVNTSLGLVPALPAPCVANPCVFVGPPVPQVSMVIVQMTYSLSLPVGINIPAPLNISFSTIPITVKAAAPICPTSALMNCS